jgi:anti-anti-sigma factor
MLTVSCSTGQAGDTILTFAGELDAMSADRAYRYVRDTIDARGGPVVLDVAGLSFCDARGLGALLRMSSHARQAGSSLYLLTPRGNEETYFAASLGAALVATWPSAEDLTGPGLQIQLQARR